MPAEWSAFGQARQTVRGMRALRPVFLAMLDESAIFIHPARSRLQDLAETGIACRSAAT
jgi:hypothetical protein